MREIEFRGIISGKIWVYGSLTKYRSGSCFIVEYKGLEGNVHNYEDIPVIPHTVGQYTGLKDRNGVKIYEGDIIHYGDVKGTIIPESLIGCDRVIAIIKYYGDVNYPAFDIEPCEFDCNGLSELIQSGNYIIEVIGNIHDNPELLQ